MLLIQFAVIRPARFWKACSSLHWRFFRQIRVDYLSIMLLTLVSPSWGVTITSNTTQTGGTFNNTGGGALIISHPTNDPLLTLTSGATTSNVNGVTVGRLTNEEGRLRVEGSSTLTNFGNGMLGQNEGSTGRATISGAGSSWANSGNLIIGESGTGELRIEAGGKVTNAEGILGRAINTSANPGSGSVTVTGTGSQWQLSELTIGLTGTGTLNVENGGQVTSMYTILGLNSDTEGTVTVTGANSQWNTGSLVIGGFGTGQLNIENSGVVTSYDAWLTGTSDSSGTVTVTGTGSKWIIGDGFYGGLGVGDGGDGELLVEAGGQVSTISGRVGLAEAGNGAITVTGAGSKLAIQGTTVTRIWIAERTECDAMGCVTIPGYWMRTPSTAEILIGGHGQGKVSVTDGGRVIIGENAPEPSLIGNTFLGYNVDSAGELLVTGEDSIWDSPTDLIVGKDGTGVLTIEAGGLVRNANGSLGSGSTGDGTATVSGAGSKWENSHSLAIGDLGHGELLIEAGGLVTNYDANIAFQTGSSGEVTVTGAGSEWRNANMLVVGHSGNGTLDILDGGLVTNLSGHVGGWFGTTSAATISGAGSEWRNANTLYVGYSAAEGTLLIEDGGLATGIFGRIGHGTGSTGIVTVTGAGSKWLNSSSFRVGAFGTGTLNIEEGGLVTAGFNITVAERINSAGTIKVVGPDSTLQGSDDLRLGYRGQGELNIGAGGLVTNVSAELGTMALSKGTATVTGTNAKWQNSGSIYLGGNATQAGGTGTLTVSGGGTVEVADTLKLWSEGTVNLQAGGTINTDNFDFSAGTFNFTGGTLTATGNVTGNLLVPDGGVVSGTGNFTNLSVLNGGSVSPGNSPGLMNSAITTWAPGGNYEVEINRLLSDGGIAGADPGWDRWNTNALTVSATFGTPFNIVLNSLTSGNVAGSLQNWDASVGESWLIATADSGTFSGSVLSHLAIDSSQFTTFNNLSGGSFSLLTANNNSELYVAFNPFVTQANNPSVPEPSSLLLFCLGGLMLARRTGSRSERRINLPLGAKGILSS